MGMRKFWERRLEKDVKELKKSAWNILVMILFKYNYQKIIGYRGYSTLDIALQIIQNEDLWEKLNENEKYYVSGLLGKDVSGGSE